MRGLRFPNGPDPAVVHLREGIEGGNFPQCTASSDHSSLHSSFLRSSLASFSPLALHLPPAPTRRLQQLLEEREREEREEREEEEVVVVVEEVEDARFVRSFHPPVAIPFLCFPPAPPLNVLFFCFMYFYFWAGSSPRGRRLSPMEAPLIP